MKLLINTASTYKGGGIQVAKSFIEECKKFTENEYFVVLGETLGSLIDLSNYPDNFTFAKAPFRPATHFFKLKSHNKFLKEAEKEFQPDIVFTTSGPSYWRSQAPHLMGYNIPHYIYPESPYFNIIPLKRKIWWKAMKLFAYYNFKYNADAFVVQTEDVNKRLRKFINKENVFTVYNTINSYYLEVQNYPNKLKVNNQNEFRLLTLSAWYPHKNLKIISKVIEELGKVGQTNIRFILTLKPEDFKNSSLSRFSEVINVGQVKIEEAPSLYKECDGMFLPTLLECFSASYVEAMKMKKPILTSDMGFAQTICENAAMYVDPMDASDITKKIIELVKSKKLQNKLIENGLNRLNAFGTAEDRAKQYLDICETMIHGKRSS